MMLLFAGSFFAFFDEFPETAGFTQFLIFTVRAHATAEEKVLQRICVQHTLDDHHSITILVLFYRKIDAVIII